MSGLPTSPGPDNLVRRAQAALEQTTGRELPARVHLDKRIPLGAGLGGGSSDAAAVLRGLNYLYALGLDGAVLEAAAAGLGQDVPFLLDGGTAWATGRGDRVASLPDLARGWVVLAWSEGAVDTGGVYRAVGERVLSRGERSRALAARLTAGSPLLPDALCNDLEVFTAGLHPRVAELRERLRAVGPFQMTGSGGAFFAWYAQPAPALRAQEGLAGLTTALCAVVPR